MGGGTTAAIYYLGVVADKWLKNFSWVGLAVAVLGGLGTTMWLKRKAAKAAGEEDTVPETVSAS
ncbi:hypothetical protein GCM10027612_47410 [Microbispora bryophytorum subsp. camponoti]